jgi:phosphate transport system substrate-binding protein
MKSFKFLALSAMIGAVLAFTAACGNESAGNTNNSGTEASDTQNGNEDAVLEGEVAIDGSSTVYPIMEAVAEEYMMEQPNVRVSVGFSGTGGGMKKFAAGETDFTNASRPMKEEEAEAAKANGIEFEEFQLAYDGLSVVVSKENDFIDHLTVEELKKMWVEDGTTKKWSDIRPEWPEEEIKFFAPGEDSGTYDYWNEVILDDEALVNSAVVSEDDNVLVQGVAGTKEAIGFFGYAYYIENTDKLKVVPIDGGEGPVEPTNETIEDGSYAPLSRPLFTYINKESVTSKPEVYDYLRFLIENAGDLAEEVGYVRLPEADYKEAKSKLEGLK